MARVCYAWKLCIRLLIQFRIFYSVRFSRTLPSAWPTLSGLCHYIYLSARGSTQSMKALEPPYLVPNTSICFDCEEPRRGPSSSLLHYHRRQPMTMRISFPELG